MKAFSQLIKFKPMDEFTSNFLTPPKPASSSIPDWYRNSPTHMDNEKKDGLSKTTNATSNLTIKGCSPFLDAMTFGYTYELPFDLEFRNDKGKLNMRWATNMDLIGGHTSDQYALLPTPFDGMEGVLKWRFTYQVITPKGYSTLFTHPINQNDLPFRILSGVVDTDSYPAQVEIPFQLLNKFDKDIYIMEKGTPLFQIIPFKRDDWKSELLEYDSKAVNKAHFDIKSKIQRSYKNQWWQKKTYG